MAIGTLAPPLDVRARRRAGRERSRIWRKFVRNPAAIAGALILFVVVGAAVFAPWVAPHEPARQSLIRRFTPPVWAEARQGAHLLGTDQVGRDILSRIIHGARISLAVGIAAVAVSLTVGVTLGLCRASCRGGWTPDHDGGGRDAVLPAIAPRAGVRGRAGPELSHHHRGAGAHRLGALHPGGAGGGAGAAREGLRGGGARHGRLDGRG